MPECEECNTLVPITYYVKVSRNTKLFLCMECISKQSDKEPEKQFDPTLKIGRQEK